jgi:hypothetical protein
MLRYEKSADALPAIDCLRYPGWNRTLAFSQCLMVFADNAQRLFAAGKRNLARPNN